MLVVAGPLVVDPWGWNPFGPARFAVMAAVVGVGTTWLLATGRARLLPPVTHAWLALLAAATLATAVAADPVLAALGDADRLFGLVSLLVAFGAYLLGCSAGDDGLRYASRALVVTVGLVSLYALAQLLGWDFLHVPAAIDTSRARSTAGNAAFLGGYLTMIIPVTLVVATGSDEPIWWRRAAAGTFVLGIAALLGTQTRSAWVGTGVAVAVVVAVARIGRWRVLLATAGLVVVVALVTPLGARALSTVDLSHGTAAGRVDTWAISIRAIARRPLLGWGPEGFRRGFEQAMTPDWVRRYGIVGIPDRAHDVVLDTAGSLGLVGVGCSAWLLVVVGRRTVRAIRGGDRLVVGVAAGLGGYLVHTLFLFDTFDLAVLFWLLAGLICARGGSSRGGVKSRQSREALQPLPSIRRWPAAAVAGSAAMGLMAWGVAGFVADRRVEAAWEANTRGDPVRAVASVARATRLRPRALEHHLLAGKIALDSRNPEALRQAISLLGRWRDPDVALVHADLLRQLGSTTGDMGALTDAARHYQAIIVDQKANGLAWLGLGESQTRLGDLDGARRALGVAADLLPRSPYPHLDLGLLDLGDHDVAAARRELERARQIDPHDPAVADLAGRIATAL